MITSVQSYSYRFFCQKGQRSLKQNPKMAYLPMKGDSFAKKQKSDLVKGNCQ